MFRICSVFIREVMEGTRRVLSIWGRVHLLAADFSCTYVQALPRMKCGDDNWTKEEEIGKNLSQSGRRQREGRCAREEVLIPGYVHTVPFNVSY